MTVQALNVCVKFHVALEGEILIFCVEDLQEEVGDLAVRLLILVQQHHLFC